MQSVEIRTIILLVAILASAPMRSSAIADQSSWQDVLIQGVPHVQQKPDFCGEACAEMYLRKLGTSIDQDFVFDQSGLDPIEGRGCYTRDLTKALRRIGFQTGQVWHRVDAGKASDEIDQLFTAMHEDLLAGIPSIVCMRYSDHPETTEHFRLILGYDARNDEILYHEPAADRGAYQRMKRKQFLSLWPLKYHSDQWTLIRLRLDFANLIEPRDSTGFTDADYAQHIRKLKKRLPGDEFNIVLERPFVVVGDEPRQRVQERSEKTVRWAVNHLKKAYFSKDPEQIIDIWLFKNKRSYENHVRELFGDHPSTPYGYYSPSHRALVMNISTGGGTLVHEIVHPFIAANFPACPSWFNEGLASLYEQCGEQNGRIWGYPNWRLAGLQRAIIDDRVPPFQELLRTTRRAFYEDDRGTNYAQARYLCQYLQEQGQLVDFYHAFVRNASTDSTGFETLQDILGSQKIDSFESHWKKYIMSLRH